MNLKEKIKKLAQEYKEEIIKDRRHLHQNPELSFQEYNTAKYIAKRLQEMGVQTKEGVADTGLIALVQGKNPDSKIIALRADIDALPILEENDVEYKSKNEGVMHACGHDVHTSSLLGTINILKELKEDFEGTVKLIFQPGEEKVPGGASLMIKEGVLNGKDGMPIPKNIIGQHVMPLLPAGTIGFREGMYMASADEIYITIKGKGGHGAMPEMGIDAVLIASHIIVALQQVISRNSSPKVPSVLSFGKVIANGATNIIPNEVKIEGTFRTYDETWRKDAHQKIKKIVVGLAESMGAKAEIDLKVGYPHLKNNPELTQKMREAAETFMGKENIVDLDLWLAAEDFAYYTQEIDACFYRLGTANEEKGITSPVHTPTFDIDESALEIGAGLMAWLALESLKT